ncbi:hypothetical protein KP509_35G030100 [Ceratopteris richardii]|nr:hypothetical protein KP509_35G030100 [Ceratopteris richardii]
MGVANAGVIFFDGHLLAMSEDDLPYAVHITRSGDLQTLGRYNFHGQFSSSMIAHPKVDFHTGELFGLSYDVIKKPYVKYFKMSRDGKKELEVNIDDVKEPTMIHDFAITENFVIIPDHQVIFSLKEMLKGSSPVLYDKDKVSRFGVLPRNAEDDSDIRWIDVPGCFCFHLWNAWEVEEMNEIVVIGSLMTPADRIFNDSGDGFRSILTEIRLNLDTLTSQKRPICPCLNLEAGQVNRKLLGRKTQYAYLAISQPWPKVSGIAKVNLQSPIPSSNSLKATNPRSHTAQHSSSIAQANIAGSFMFPSNCFGGEPMFVPRCQNPEAEEDDGYVLTFMYNESTGRSELLVLDARSPSLQMIASIKIPTRVPYGFHGTFIRESELKRQKK